MSAKIKEFDLLLLDSIDEALLSLGEKARQSIYAYTEKNNQFSRAEIPQNIETFQQVLEKIFGIGARFIEILIMKNLYAKIGCQLNVETNKQLEFVNYVDAARKDFTKNEPR